MGAVAVITSRRLERCGGLSGILVISGSLLSLLLAASCDIATSNTLKDVAVDREACEDECAADAPSPVCDMNNAQYPNRCSAETCARTTVACDGQCPCIQCDCPETENPVCGEDNVTYNNKCEMKCRNIIIQCEKACPC